MRGMTDREDPHFLSRRTTPTWEVEMLISGVAVFAMLQLPGLLDDAVFALRPRFEERWQVLLILAYMYAKGAALILALTFVAHLLLRARWIALVGMHSVYPDGIRWDQLRIGPILRSLEQAREKPFPDIIEAADNRATVVFAVGVMLAMFVVVIAAVAISLSVAAMLLSGISSGWLSTDAVLMGLLALAMVPFMLAMLLDRMAGKRLTPGSFGHRSLTWLLRLYTRLGFSRNANPVMALLASHGGDRKVVLGTTGLLFLALALAASSLTVKRQPALLGNYGLFPTDRALPALDNAHYDDQRNPLRDQAVPYIPTRIVLSPWLPLMVPYRPEIDAPALRSHCAHATSLPREEQARARLDCLTTLHAVRIDGIPVKALRFELASDPKTDRPALLAMLDIRHLPQGRHELTIARPSDNHHNSTSPDALQVDTIPFWR